MLLLSLKLCTAAPRADTELSTGSALHHVMTDGFPLLDIHCSEHWLEFLDSTLLHDESDEVTVAEQQ